MPTCCQFGDVPAIVGVICEPEMARAVGGEEMFFFGRLVAETL